MLSGYSISEIEPRATLEPLDGDLTPGSYPGSQ